MVVVDLCIGKGITAQSFVGFWPSRYGSFPISDKSVGPREKEARDKLI